MDTAMSYFDESEQKELLDWYDHSKEYSDDLTTKMYERLFGVMPYGVAKARTGDPVDWVCNYLSAMKRDEFLDFIEE